MMATLFATPYLLHKVGAEAYGIFGMITILSGQMGILQLGVGPAATRVVAHLQGAGEERRYQVSLAAIVAMGAAASIWVAVLFASLAPWMWRAALKASPATLEVALASVGSALVIVGTQPIYGALSGIIAGNQEFRYLSLLRLGHGLLRLLVSVAVASRDGGVVAILGAQAVTDLGVVLMAGKAIPYNPSKPISPREIGTEGLRVLGVGVPFAIAGALQSLLSDVEKLMIGFGHSLLEFTYYTVPYNAVMKLTILPSALAATLLPVLSARAASGDLRGATEITRKATRLLLIAMSWTLLPLAALTPEILRLWLGTEFSLRGSQPMRILLVALLAYVNVYAPHAVIRGRAHPVSLPLLYSIELAIHVFVVYWCVRAWGITGAAVAWLFRAAMDAAGHRYIAGRTLGAHTGRFWECWSPVLGLAGCVVWFEGVPALHPAARILLASAVAAATTLMLARPGDAEILGRALVPWRR
jgi:O-antigen/teichoic acid export membrane protein